VPLLPPYFPHPPTPLGNLLSFSAGRILSLATCMDWTACLFSTPISSLPRAGVEPARLCRRGILSPLRLPIPPSRLETEVSLVTHTPCLRALHLTVCTCVKGYSVSFHHSESMRGKGLEPTRLSTPDPKSGASANFANLASNLYYTRRLNDVNKF